MSLDWTVAPLPVPDALPLETVALKAALLRLPREWFAVFDGALFGDLAGDLSLHGFVGRPLFLEAGDPQAVAVGPFLVVLAGPEDVDRLFVFNGARRSPVFWSWPTGEAALYRHLRTLNLAEIPNESRASEDAPAYEAVIFRHWDPVVLGQMLPLLRPGQVSRFLGAGQGVCFEAGVGGGLNVRMRPLKLAAPETGMLRFSPGQMGDLLGRRAVATHQRIDRFLREAAPAETTAMNAQAMGNLIRHGEATGRALGLRSERALGLWTLMMLNTGGAAAGSAEVAAAFAQSRDTPDTTMEFLFLAMKHAAEDALAEEG